MTEELFAQNYEKHYNGTLRFLSAKGASKELAEDTCQAAWARAWEKREQFQGTSSFHSWVNTIAWNHYLSYLRKRPIEQFPEHFDAPVDPVDQHTKMDAERALRLCTVDERRLLATRYLQDMTYEEVAKVLSLNQNTLKTRVARLAHKLRVKLTPLPRKCKRRAPQWRRHGVKHATECDWCGVTFEYRSTLLPNGQPRYLRRVCSRACIAAMAHEGRRKLPMNGKRLRELYEVKKLSTTQIAKMFGCATHKSVCRALAKHGIQLRDKGRSSDGKCTKCGEPVIRKKNGAPLASLCREHQREYQRDWARQVRAKDPEVGFRPLGRKRKPIACPRCGTDCMGTREALAHCSSVIRQERARRGWITRKQRMAS